MGTLRPASLTSSAMWAVASEPFDFSLILVIDVGRDKHPHDRQEIFFSFFFSYLEKRAKKRTLTERTINCRNLTNHESEADGGPSAKVGELAENLGR